MAGDRRRSLTPGVRGRNESPARIPFFLCSLAFLQAHATVFACKNPDKFNAVNDALVLKKHTYKGDVTYIVEFPPELYGQRFIYAELVVGTLGDSFVKSVLHPDWRVLRTKKGWLYEEIDSKNSRLPMTVLAHYGDMPRCKTVATLVIRK